MLVLAGFLLALSTPGAAAPAQPRPVVVLLDSSAAMPADLRAQLLPALQAEVERSAGYKWTEPPPVSVDELALALNCDGMDDGCLRRAGDNLKTDAVLLVSVGSGGRKEVTLSLVHVRPPRPSKVLSVGVTDTASTVTEVRAAARGLLGPVRPTRLVVLTAPPGALVTVDGRTVGKSPATLADVTDGAHTVEVTLKGYQPQETQVQAPAGQSTEVRLTLVEEPPTPVAATPATPRKSTATAAAPDATPQPAPDQAGTTAAAGPAPAWHAVKWVAPVPGILTALVAMVGLAAGVTFTAMGAHGYTSETGPTTQRSLRGVVWNIHQGACGGGVAGPCALFTQSKEDGWMIATTAMGVVMLGGSVVAFLAGVGLLAAAPVPILLFE